MRLSHVDAEGRARMVDVTEKPITKRLAVAEGRVEMSHEAFTLVLDASSAKGDVLAVAQIAGIMAAKKTSELVPLCHPVQLDDVQVQVEPISDWPGVAVTATVRATARTGVEMEALVAVSTACLTVYDMIKAADRGARMTGIRVLEKSGGSRGNWTASTLPDHEKE